MGLVGFHKIKGSPPRKEDEEDNPYSRIDREKRRFALHDLSFAKEYLGSMRNLHYVTLHQLGKITSVVWWGFIGPEDYEGG